MSLYEEMYRAYVEGRSTSDPSQSWYGGELTFFDRKVIPLAQRLVSCRCFGLMADEFLSNAEQNRAEWAEKGREIVAEMVAKAQEKNGLEATPAKEENSQESGTSNTTNSEPPRDFLAETLSANSGSAAEQFQDELETRSIGSIGSISC